MNPTQYASLETLKGKLQSASSLHDKLIHLNQDATVLRTPILWTDLSVQEEYIAKSLIAIGEESILHSTQDRSQIARLLSSLAEIDSFYRELGGLIGYQWEIARRMCQGTPKTPPPSYTLQYHAPTFVDISQETPLVQETIHAGLEALPLLAELYPLGGAADRLHLIDAATSLELPAAKLPFAGHTLLESLIRDLQAREFLYFRCTGKEVFTPLALMTSLEKDNHHHVLAICEAANWFHRPRELFRLFSQPSVPVVNAEGRWILTGPATILTKPGGHGALWKLAKDHGIFEWLRSLGRHHALIRQINNPLAGTDGGLLAFLGHGVMHQMRFGFASCPRLLHAAEGINVLIEKRYDSFKEVTLTNIEYCDFHKAGIAETPLCAESPYSCYSSNTNILFANLAALEEALEQSPFPGLLINLKAGRYTSCSGEKKEEVMTRLESTMQNIADVFVERQELSETIHARRTFVTYNHRHKTISSAKKAYQLGQSLNETPERCFYDLLQTRRQLLETECHFSLPPPHTLQEYLQEGPECLFLYHPALGPLYSLIRNKISQGTLEKGAFLQLEIAELSLQQLTLKGALRIHADQIMGKQDASGILRYSNCLGQCLLEQVTIENQGVDWLRSQPYWKGEWPMKESVSIHLRGHSLFRGRNLHLQGSHHFVVEDGMCMDVSQKDGTLHIETRALGTVIPTNAQNLALFHPMQQSQHST